METKDTTKGEPCGQAFGENVDKKVDTVEQHTPGEHDKRQHEVNASFNREGEKGEKDEKENCSGKSCETNRGAGSEWHAGNRSEHGADAGCASKEGRPSHTAYGAKEGSKPAAEHGMTGEIRPENHSGGKSDLHHGTDENTKYDQHGQKADQQHDQQHGTTSHYPGKN